MNADLVQPRRPSPAANSSTCSRRCRIGASHGDGEFTRRCHGWLAEITGSQRALLTTSCTHALEMAALLLDLVAGDEVICPAFTFVSTANAGGAARRAVPVFVDVRPDTLNLDERLFEAAITPRTRAIIVVHYAGVACEMDADPRRRGAPRPGGDRGQRARSVRRYRGRPLGSLRGDVGAQLPRDQEPVVRRRRGAAPQRPALVERAEIIREKGTNRTRFFRGEVDKYTWVDIGSSYLPSDLLAAYLWAQLESPRRIQRRRHEIWSRYATELAPWATAAQVRLPVVPDHCDHPAHIFYLLMPSLERRTALLGICGSGRFWRGVPLPAAAPVRDGPPLGGARGSVRSPRMSAIGSCGCRCSSS
jgi:dTDP-4-amino-4,6-dideoxygalactose transaminase